MKILLDECLPRHFQKHFADYGCKTAAEAGFAGKKNGELLRLADSAGFDVLITVDRNIRHQQNLAGRRISVVILNVATNRLPDLLPLVPACLKALQSIQSGEVRQLP